MKNMKFKRFLAVLLALFFIADLRSADDFGSRKKEGWFSFVWQMLLGNSREKQAAENELEAGDLEKAKRRAQEALRCGLADLEKEADRNYEAEFLERHDYLRGIHERKRRGVALEHAAQAQQLQEAKEASELVALQALEANQQRAKYLELEALQRQRVALERELEVMERKRRKRQASSQRRPRQVKEQNRRQLKQEAGKSEHKDEALQLKAPLFRQEQLLSGERSPSHLLDVEGLSLEDACGASQNDYGPPPSYEDSLKLSSPEEGCLVVRGKRIC